MGESYSCLPADARANDAKAGRLAEAPSSIQ
jgi:hypothetical protein